MFPFEAIIEVQIWKMQLLMLISKKWPALFQRDSKKAAAPLLMLISKNVAGSILKGSQKSSCPFTNANFPLKKWPHLYQKNAKKVAAPLQKQNFKKRLLPVLPFAKGKGQSSFCFSKGDV